MKDISSNLLIASTAAVGIGAAWISWLKDTPIGAMLFMNYSVSPGTTGIILQSLAVILLISVIALFFKSTRLLGSGIIFGYVVVLIYAAIDQGGYPFSNYSVAAYAMRLSAPAALLIVFSTSIQERNSRFSYSLVLWLIILSTSATFIIHGVEAILAHPWFIDMTITMAKNLAGWSITQSSAEQLLIAVGILDIISALALIIFRSPLAAAWMTFWGFFTCLLRIVNYGMGGLPDAIIRLPHGLLPMILLIEFSKNRVK